MSFVCDNAVSDAHVNVLKVPTRLKSQNTRDTFKIGRVVMGNMKRNWCSV